MRLDHVTPQNRCYRLSTVLLRTWSAALPARAERTSVRSQSLQFLDQGRPLDPQQFRGLVPIPPGAFERSLDEVALDVCQITRQVQPLVWEIDKGHRLYLRRLLHLRRQIRHINLQST